MIGARCLGLRAGFAKANCSPMSYSLRPDLTFCFVQQRAVFLDMAADRYFCLDGPADDGFSRLVGGEPLTSFDHEILTRLVTRDILNATDMGNVPTPCRHPAPRISHLGGLRALPAMRQLPSIIWHLTATNRRLRAGAFAHLVQHVARTKTQICKTNLVADNLYALARTYDWTRRFVMPLDHCLVRAIALATQAAKAGYPIDLVFGVQLRPFAAHCWVEHDGMVLDDRLDHVGHFTPILAI